METANRGAFVIVGGGLAAAEAAKTLRAQAYGGRLVVIADEPHLPYERPPLTKAYLRGEVGDDALLAQPASFYEDAGVELLTGHRAVRLDLGARTLALDDGAVVGFARLLLATGSRATRPGIPGIDEPWVHVLRTVADADRVRASVGDGTSVIVAGGGWIAAEAAASLRQMGCEVTLAVPGTEVLERHLGPVAGRAFTELHEAHGTRVARGARVTAFEVVQGRRVARLDSGELVAGDLAVVGFGATPATGLATGAGLEVDDGIVADERLMTGAEGVFVAGDAASAWNPRYGQRVRSEHWDNARRQGRTAARNMLGGSEAYDRVPYFFSDQFDLEMELFGRPGVRDRVLVRREDAGLVVAWTRDGRMVAGMHTNVRASRKALDRLVSSGAELDVSSFLDGTVPLDTALGAPA